jgi:predicted transcriptional regulator YdeE
MKVMVMVKATQESEAGAMPSQQLLMEMGKFNEELVKAGILLSAEGLHPSSKGARVRFSGKDRTVIDGPFSETKELVAGFWLWQVKSMEEAIAWVKRCPNPMTQDSEIEIRRVFAPEDFGAALTPELQQQEQQMRAEVAGYHLDPPRFENRGELVVAGLNGTYTFETRSQIPAQWVRFAPQIGKIPGQVGTTAYGVCWNYKPGVGFDYLSGVEVGAGPDLPVGVDHVRIPAGRYAVFTHRQHVSAIANTIDAIWTRWLPNSGQQAAGTPSFERYGVEFDPRSGMGGFEIWVPLKS